MEVKGRDKLKVGPFNLEFVTVTHSIPDALAVYVKTPAGSLIDTGDIKLDQLPLDHKITDLVEFGKIGEQGVDLLMMDSTNAEVPGFVKPETSIGPALDQAFAQASRKIIVASFSSHVHRVQQVVDVAHKYGRKVVFVGRSMVRNMSIAADLGYLHIPEGTVVDLKQANDIQDDKLVFMCTGSQGEPMAALGRIADGNHRDITINEFDTVILASSHDSGRTSTACTRSSTSSCSSARASSTATTPPCTCPATATRASCCTCTTSSSPNARCPSTARTATWSPTA